MIITAIERTQKQRGRVDVYVDGALACDLARSVAAAHGLRPGGAIAQEQIEAIVAADRRRAALDAAAAMLARRPRSEREVRQRLKQQKFEPALIDETVGRLVAAKLLDDAEFARAWTESRERHSPRGRRLIVQELRANGVEASIAERAAAEVSDEDAAYRLASRRMRSLERLAYEAFRNRLGTYLQRRGFGWDVCRATVDRCWREGPGRTDDGETTDNREQTTEGE